MTLKVERLGHSTRLQEVSFAAQPGELVGILGANGAGKSTLLQLLCGVLEPDAGQLTYQQRDLSQISAYERRQLLGYLPQTPVAEGGIRVDHFLQAGLVNLHLSCPGKELNRVVETLQIHALLERTLDKLSGGEQRRVHIARALLGDHNWLLCDEPTTSLDLYYQLQVMAVLRAQADRGKLVTLALHDLGLAARYCDRLVLIDKGRLLAEGTPAAVLTDANLAQAYKIKARWLCTDEGVTLLPSLLS
ncbi:ABC transporter ATP-binding protein [Pseudidiomarina sp. 1ASP75-14]|uniref:ABC transporter ATP-binding protein n=1 Tax=Pseudidiomarina terrestris TaxID=2820060 RepID=UPI00264CFA8B|nr:ABC transporter ATP-binding protein [Pseudidiomarina sp. 1ASP75-14]MDN7138908.1 ABC transporter ATP-binding protein [Pseudidiomarina sp. 1ASP75-14]